MQNEGRVLLVVVTIATCWQMWHFLLLSVSVADTYPSAETPDIKELYSFTFCRSIGAGGAISMVSSFEVDDDTNYIVGVGQENNNYAS